MYGLMFVLTTNFKQKKLRDDKKILPQFFLGNFICKIYYPDVTQCVAQARAGFQTGLLLWEFLQSDMNLAVHPTFC